MMLRKSLLACAAAEPYPCDDGGGVQTDARHVGLLPPWIPRLPRLTSFTKSAQPSALQDPGGDDDDDKDDGDDYPFPRGSFKEPKPEDQFFEKVRGDTPGNRCPQGSHESVSGAIVPVNPENA